MIWHLVTRLLAGTDTSSIFVRQSIAWSLKAKPWSCCSPDWFTKASIPAGVLTGSPPGDQTPLTEPGVSAVRLPPVTLLQLLPTTACHVLHAAEIAIIKKFQVTKLRESVNIDSCSCCNQGFGTARLLSIAVIQPLPTTECHMLPIAVHRSVQHCTEAAPATDVL